MIAFIDAFGIHTYTGQFKIRTKCLHCGNSTHSYEPFTCILLTPNQAECKLYDLFEDLLQKETIEQYQCDHCKLFTTAERKTWIYTLPKRLIVVLKKYTYKTKVDYPNKSMKVRDVVSNQIQQYSCYAVISHHGSHSKGHYSCNIKINKKWYFMDDTDIFLNEKMNFKDPDAYILIYEAISPCTTSV